MVERGFHFPLALTAAEQFIAALAGNARHEASALTPFLQNDATEEMTVVGRECLSLLSL